MHTSDGDVHKSSLLRVKPARPCRVVGHGLLSTGMDKGKEMRGKFEVNTFWDNY